MNQGCKFELKLKKVGCFAELEKTVLTLIWFKLDPLLIACLAARRILYISAVILHFGYKYTVTMLFLTEHQKFDSSKGARQNKKSIIS